jgi:hypothetical protein
MPVLKAGASILMIRAPPPIVWLWAAKRMRYYGLRTLLSSEFRFSFVTSPFLISSFVFSAPGV